MKFTWNHFESFFSVPVLFVLLLWILALASLLTVVERKGLASSQRRLGPSYHGWFGLLQIVADGLKLIYKDSALLGLFRSSSTNSHQTYYTSILPPLYTFLWSYFVFLLFWMDFSQHSQIPFVFFPLFLVQGLSHCGLILCGLFTQSKYTVLGSLRANIVYLIYDMVLLLTWFVLMPHSSSGPNLWESNQFGSFVSYQNIQESGSYCILFPLFFFVFYFAILIECGRVPADLAEAESELVSGFNLEYGGFLYALFASAEYSNMFFNTLIVSLLFFGGAGRFDFLAIVFTLIFLSFLIVRATLPRIRYTDLFVLSWQYFIPFNIACCSFCCFI